MNPHPDTDRFVIRGRVHLSLHAVARCFEVRVAWLEQVCECGLLGSCPRVEDHVAIAATELDRVAQIVRLHFHQGVDLHAILVLLGRAATDPTEHP